MKIVKGRIIYTKICLYWLTGLISVILKILTICLMTKQNFQVLIRLILPGQLLTLHQGQIISILQHLG